MIILRIREASYINEVVSIPDIFVYRIYLLILASRAPGCHLYTLTLKNDSLVHPKTFARNFYIVLTSWLLLQVAVTSICIFVILPLNLVGTVLGRNMAGQPNYPCRINAVPRPIPEKKWFMEPAVIVFLGGVLPFGSIFIEM